MCTLETKENGLLKNLPACVLLVDDESMIRNAGSRILSRLGCRVLIAEDGKEALSVYRQSQNEIDLVILDLGMPKMNGIECLKALKSIDPGVRVVVSTGYVDDERSSAIMAKGAVGILPKPYDVPTLATLFKGISI